MPKITNPHNFLWWPQPCSAVPSEVHGQTPNKRKVPRRLVLKFNTVSGALVKLATCSRAPAGYSKLQRGKRGYLSTPKLTLCSSHRVVMREAKSQTCQSKKPNKDPKARESLAFFHNPKETSPSRHLASSVCVHVRTHL